MRFCIYFEMVYISAVLFDESGVVVTSFNSCVLGLKSFSKRLVVHGHARLL